MSRVSKDNPVVLVGAGKMGGAMLAGWLKTTPANHFHIVDPAPASEMMELISNESIPHSKSAPEGIAPSVVIVAVKPQVVDAVLPTIVTLADAKPVFISVLAGTPLATYENSLGADVAVIRAMPNTPAQVGRGITAGLANAAVSVEQKALAADLLAVTGAFVWVETEEQIDAVTAVSGSGPAYVFHMVEALAAAAEEAGLPSQLGLQLARATIEGAGELLYQSDLDAGTLRKNVTSPGGTTAAALDVLTADEGLTALMIKAVAAAKRRAEELAR